MPGRARPFEPPFLPLLCDEALALLEQIMENSQRWRVLEWGSGASTLYFAERVYDVVSVEHAPDWRDEVVAALKAHGLFATVLLVKPRAFRLVPYLFHKGAFDLVFIDGHQETRKSCVRTGKRVVKRNRWMIVDDSQWGRLSDTPQVLDEFRLVQRIDGRKASWAPPYRMRPTQTSFYKRR